MPGKLQQPWPEVLVSTSETAVAVSRAMRKGTLRKLGNRLYTTNLTGSPESIVRRHLWQIVGSFVPDGLIADRTAIENAPAADGSVFLIADRFRPVALPGLTIKPRKGPPPLESDRPFIGGLRLSSTARAYLENMAVSRPREGQVGRTLTTAEIEERLETLARRGGADALNRLRDEARAIAPELKLEDAFARLDKLIGAILGTREAALATPQARARQAGAPYDIDRQSLFEALHSELRKWPPTIRRAAKRTPDESAVFAFYESYFSNFIEGTEFEVDEAADIVFNGHIPSARPEDAHDILGTYRLAVDFADNGRVPKTADELIQLLKVRQAAVMSGRPDKNPGFFKERGNRAGGTIFVAPELTVGTLSLGFQLYQNLDSAFARAVFMMFLVAEVHPFDNGNGRTARLMMNAELTAEGEERIIIPTIYRNNYLSALRALSLNAEPEPLIRTLDFAQRWTVALEWQSVENTQHLLTTCNAFVDPNSAEERGLRLRMPSGS
ncbi:MAG TPA: Fic family protein [Magnetospirillaceae bacterium]|jgi:hypothetical protein